MMRVVSKKRMGTETIYGYCPYCVASMQRAELDYKKELKPLWEILTVTQEKKEDGTAFPYFEKLYECERCRKALKLEHFVNFYTRRPDGTKWSDPRQPQLPWAED